MSERGRVVRRPRSDRGSAARGKTSARGERYGLHTAAKVLAAAQSVFGQRGYGGTRVADVAAAAGIAQSAIYQYYDSKQQLYQAAFVAAQTELVAQFTGAIVAGQTFADRVEQIFAASARVYAANPVLTPFLASLPLEMRRHPDLLPELHSSSAEFVAALATMFADARRAGEIPPHLTDTELTTALMGTVIGVGLFGFGMSMISIDKPFAILAAAFRAGLTTGS